MTNILDIHTENKNELIEKMNVDLKSIRNDLKLILENRESIKNLYFEQEYDSEFARQYTKEQFKFGVAEELEDLNEEFNKMDIVYRKFMKRMNVEEDLEESMEIKKINELKMLINNIVLKTINVISYHTVDLDSYKMIFDELNQPEVGTELKMMVQSIDSFREDAIDFLSSLITKFNLQDEIDYRNDSTEEEV